MQRFVVVQVVNTCLEATAVTAILSCVETASPSDRLAYLVACVYWGVRNSHFGVECSSECT